ncbi:YxeA family protein [Lacticaseibacillus parakribbianus]|uniref:YxeA family protein n=1 Tax=Lacticaseibacillus parakribbianus TaxID=2970927 RepID=UPI0021CB6230|nr:YxeA family protein [Lacticaseibacillus parakribbianus]
MKKILAVIGLVIVFAGGWFGYKYYASTYAGATGYTKVTTTPARHKTTDDSGKTIAGYYSYDYSFTWALKDGTTKTVNFELSSKNPQPYVEGKYLKAEISDKRVIKGPSYVDESAIPQKALDALK